MAGSWSAIWLSPWRATLAGALLSALIASTLYAFNWHTFYDTRRNMAIAQAGRVADDVADLVHAADADDDDFREALRHYIGRRRAAIEVRLGPEGAPVWTLRNEVPIDATRTQLIERFEIAAPGDVPERLAIVYQQGIRPPLATALSRAWTFSIADYLREPERWWSEHLYNRSIPLWGYLLTITVAGFGTIRALHRDQHELVRLGDEGSRVADELAGLRERRRVELAEIRGQLERSENGREEALRERARLSGEIERVEREYGQLDDGRSVADGVHDERLRTIAARKARIEREMKVHDEKLAFYENELGDVRGELTAAEELLAEVDDRHEDLMKRLRDRNKRIRHLQELVDQAQRDSHAMQLQSAGSGRSPGAAPTDADEVGLRMLEDQLAAWLHTPGEAQVNFSQHSKSVIVEEQFARLDRDFVDRHFTHANNREYARGSRKLIRVQTATDRGEGDRRRGELIICLDDDAGRTLGLRYETKRDAPDPAHVGFALALLVRARCRDLRSFEIRLQ